MDTPEPLLGPYPVLLEPRSCYRAWVFRIHTVIPSLARIFVTRYVAKKDDQLTVTKGEQVIVLDDQKRWWLCRNEAGEEGKVSVLLVV